MTKKELIFQCHGCRKPKLIVKWAKGMKYCADCEHKAPTKEKFDEFLNENTMFNSNLPFPDERKKKDKFDWKRVV